MAIKYERNQVLLVKVEATRGVDATPSASTDAVLCAVVNPSVDGQNLDNPEVRNSIAASKQQLVNKRLSMQIQCLLKGSGTAGTKPQISALLQASGLKETVVEAGEEVDAEVNYHPTNLDSEMKTVTAYLYKDGTLYKAVGCMANISSVNNAGEFPTITFNLEGKLAATPSDAVNPTPTYQEVDPVEVKNEGFTFGSWDGGIIRNFNFETGNTINSRKNINAVDGVESSSISGRAPTWSATIEAVAEATNAFWDDFENEETVALGFTHGSVDGNIVKFSAPAANYTNIGVNSEDGIVMYDLQGQLLESSGSDDFTLTFK